MKLLPGSPEQAEKLQAFYQTLMTNAWPQEQATAYLEVLREFPDLDEDTLRALQQRSTRIYAYNLDELQALQGVLKALAKLEKLQPLRQQLVSANAWSEEKAREHIESLLVLPDLDEDTLHYLEEHSTTIYAPNLGEIEVSQGLLKTPAGKKITAQFKTLLYDINDLFINLKFRKEATTLLCAAVVEEFKVQSKLTGLNEQALSEYIMHLVTQFIEQKLDLDARDASVNSKTMKKFLSGFDGQVQKTILDGLKKMFATEVNIAKFNKLVIHVEHVVSPLVQALHEKTEQWALNYKALALMYQQVMGKEIAGDTLVPIFIEMLKIISDSSVEATAVILQFEFNQLVEALQLDFGERAYLLTSLELAQTALHREAGTSYLEAMMTTLESLTVGEYEDLQSSQERHKLLNGMILATKEFREVFLSLSMEGEEKKLYKEHFERALDTLLIKTQKILAYGIAQNSIEVALPKQLGFLLHQARLAFISLALGRDEYEIESSLIRLESMCLQLTRLYYEQVFQRNLDPATAYDYAQAIVKELNDGLKHRHLGYADIQQSLHILQDLSEYQVGAKLVEIEGHLSSFADRVATSQEQVKKFDALREEMTGKLEERFANKIKQFEKHFLKLLRIPVSLEDLAKASSSEQRARFSKTDVYFDPAAGIDQFSNAIEKLVLGFSEINLNLCNEADRDAIGLKIIDFHAYCAQQKQELIRSFVLFIQVNALAEYQELKSEPLKQAVYQKTLECMDKLKIFADAEMRSDIEVLKLNFMDSCERLKDSAYVDSDGESSQHAHWLGDLPEVDPSHYAEEPASKKMPSPSSEGHHPRSFSPRLFGPLEATHSNDDITDAQRQAVDADIESDESDEDESNSPRSPSR